MSVAAASVLGLAVYEASLLTRRGSAGRGHFCLRYGIAQIMPSIIWATKPAQLVARKIRSPEHLLRNFEATGKDAIKDTQRAYDKSRADTLATLRSIIAGFVGISQILRIMGIAGESVDEYKANIFNGTAPFMTGVNERVIRLGGKDSDVTALSMQMHGLHILPIFESPQTIRPLIKRASHDGTVPCFWHIPSGSYSLLASDNHWEGFKIDQSFYIETQKKVTTPSGQEQREKVLIVEADSSVGEQALALGVEAENDLTAEEMGQAFVSLQQLSHLSRRKSVAKNDTDAAVRMVRVLLADPNVSVRSGGGSVTNYREYLERMDEVDVFIDAKLPLLRAVEEWAEKALDESSDHAPQWRHWDKPRGHIVFDTGNTTYFKTMKFLLESRGWKVVDRPAGASNAPAGSLWLVYEDSTVNTVHKMRKLLQAKVISDPSRCCALLDKHEGMNQLRQLSRELQEEEDGGKGGKDTCPLLPFVCSSRLYDSLFAKVRALVRQGKSNEEIQAVLDALYPNKQIDKSK